LHLERARDVGEPRAEQERMHALPRISNRMEEMQEQPRVLAHRARNIEQRDDRRLLGAGPKIFQIDQRAARLHTGTKGAAHVDDVAVAMRRETPRPYLIEREHEALDRVLRLRNLGRAHLREVLLLQYFAVRDGEARVELDLALLFLKLLVHAGEQGVLHTLCA